MVTATEIQIPRWAMKRLDAASVQRIEEAIHQAELETSGEIVPMIVARSSTVGHVFPLLLAIFGVFYFAFDVSALGRDGPYHWLIAVGSSVFVLLAAGILSQFAWVQRLLTGADDQMRQVEMRAEVEFFEAGLNRTRGGTGILLFLSMMEHKAVVLADEAIAAKLPPETWGEAVASIVAAARRGSLADGLVRAIDRCGALLSGHFPATSDNPNEIRNHLIVKS